MNRTSAKSENPIKTRMWKCCHGFWGEGKNGLHVSLERTNNKLNPVMWRPARESNPGHIGGQRVLSAVTTTENE